MSSQSKRRAESEEVTHKKRPRKEGEEGGDFNQVDGDELDVEDDAGALDEDNIILTGRRTLGKRVTKEPPGLGNDKGWVPPGDEEKGSPARPQTGSPQRKPAEDIEEGEEDEEEEEGEYGEDDDDDDAASDDYEEDEEE